MNNSISKPLSLRSIYSRAWAQVDGFKRDLWFGIIFWIVLCLIVRYSLSPIWATNPPSSIPTSLQVLPILGYLIFNFCIAPIYIWFMMLSVTRAKNIGKSGQSNFPLRSIFRYFKFSVMLKGLAILAPLSLILHAFNPFAFPATINHIKYASYISYKKMTFLGIHFNTPVFIVMVIILITLFLSVSSLLFFSMQLLGDKNYSIGKTIQKAFTMVFSKNWYKLLVSLGFYIVLIVASAATLGIAGIWLVPFANLILANLYQELV